MFDNLINGAWGYWGELVEWIYPTEKPSQFRRESLRSDEVEVFQQKVEKFIADALKERPPLDSTRVSREIPPQAVVPQPNPKEEEVKAVLKLVAESTKGDRVFLRKFVAAFQLLDQGEQELIRKELEKSKTQIEPHYELVLRGLETGTLSKFYGIKKVESGSRKRLGTDSIEPLIEKLPPLFEIREGLTLEEFDKSLEKIWKSLVENVSVHELRKLPLLRTLKNVFPLDKTEVGKRLTQDYVLLSDFVILSILVASNMEKVTNRIKAWLHIMQELESYQPKMLKGKLDRMGNYGSWHAIFVGLGSHPISRLTVAWEKLGEKYRIIFQNAQNHFTGSRNIVSFETGLFDRAVIPFYGRLNTFFETAKVAGSLQHKIELIADNIALPIQGITAHIRNIRIPDDSAPSLVLPMIVPEEKIEFFDALSNKLKLPPVID